MFYRSPERRLAASITGRLAGSSVTSSCQSKQLLQLTDKDQAPRPEYGELVLRHYTIYLKYRHPEYLITLNSVPAVLFFESEKKQ